jgi:hypothetical protein
VLARAREIAVRLAGFPGDGVARIKTSIRAASARMPARDWFDAAAAHDPLAGAAPVAPARVPPPRG